LKAQKYLAIFFLLIYKLGTSPEDYIQKKEQEGLNLKFENKKPKPDYLFLVLKLQAIEKAIARELGKPALKEIKLLYEMEMTERILRSTEH